MTPTMTNDKNPDKIPITILTIFLICEGIHLIKKDNLKPKNPTPPPIMMLPNRIKNQIPAFASATDPHISATPIYPHKCMGKGRRLYAFPLDYE